MNKEIYWLLVAFSLIYVARLSKIILQNLQLERSQFATSTQQECNTRFILHGLARQLYWLELIDGLSLWWEEAGVRTWSWSGGPRSPGGRPRSRWRTAVARRWRRTSGAADFPSGASWRWEAPPVRDSLTTGGQNYTNKNQIDTKKMPGKINTK